MRPKNMMTKKKRGFVVKVFTKGLFNKDYKFNTEQVST